jgi:DNA-binding IclR family transcriptional regulator
LAEQPAPAPAAAPAHDGPRSPLRVMLIVELLAGAHRGLTLAAMTEALQIPKTSLLTHLRVLAGAGYVGLRDGRYTLGPAAMRLGVVIAAGVGVLAAARPVLADLAARSGETAMVATLDERRSEAVCIDVVDGEHDVRYSPRVGSRWPLYCTGMGRALLAFQDAAAIDAYFASAHPDLTF